MSESKSRLGFLFFIVKLLGKIVPTLLKFTKVGLAAATFGGYAVLYSWKFAVLFMIGIGFHEAGHVWAMKKMGIKTKGFYFLPFIGGVAIAEEKYRTYGENSFISIMGPIWGAALSYVCWVVYLVTGNTLWAASAAWMATVNLFNLFPINPLDGGQLLKAISFSISNRAGIVFLSISLVASLIVMVMLNLGLFVIFLFIGACELYVEFRRRSREKARKANMEALNNHMKIWFPNEECKDCSEQKSNTHPAPMNKSQLIATAVSYVGTIVVLIVLLKLTMHIPGADIAHNFLE